MVFDMSILTDKKKQAEIAEMADLLIRMIKETYRIAKENNELLKELTKKEVL